MIRSTLASAMAAALGLSTVIGAVSAQAADGYNASIAGQRNYGPLVQLATSSTQDVDIVNLPAGVGLYALHCKVPADPRSTPTLCDESEGAAAYLPAAGEARASATLPIRVNGEFYGMDPNPQASGSEGESVDCRAEVGDPRATACAVYVLGAGRDSANPAYLRVFPTVFLSVPTTRKNDVAQMSVDGAVIGRDAKAVVKAGEKVPFAVTLKSGLTPTVTADNCRIADGTIEALVARGTCVVMITSTGGRNYRPLVTTRVVRISR